jgi:FixJ family two-component response regulator
VIESADAAAGLRVHAEQRDAICLVIADVVMPGQSGLELAAGLRQAQPQLPVVLTSGYRAGGPDAEPAAIPAGVVFVHKPLAPDQLLRVVRAAIDMAPEPASETPSH